MDCVDALVLAGAKNEGKLARISRSPYEALIELNGRPMVLYVLDALARCPDVLRVVVVGPVDALKDAIQEWRRVRAEDGSSVGLSVEVVAEGSTIGENIAQGIRHLAPTGKVLVVTSDIPLLSGQMVTQFLQSAANNKAELYYPIVRREACELKFPGVKRTYVYLRDGVFTGGNLVLIEPSIVARCHQMIDRAVSLRKAPLKLSRMLGFKFLVKFALRILTVAEIEERVAGMLGCRGMAIICPDPEVGLDVDKPSDLEVAERVLQAGSF